MSVTVEAVSEDPSDIRIRVILGAEQPVQFLLSHDEAKRLAACLTAIVKHGPQPPKRKR